MERLTEFHNGIWGMSVAAAEKGYDRYSIFSKLAEYENTGLTPEQIREIDHKCIEMFGVGIIALVEKFREFLEEFHEYLSWRQAEESERLHVLPDIKLYKTLYWIWGNEIMPVKYFGINGGCIDSKGKFHITCKMKIKKERIFEYKSGKVVVKAGDKRYFYADDINKDVFLTREEAEAKLAEMEGGHV